MSEALVSFRPQSQSGILGCFSIIIELTAGTSKCLGVVQAEAEATRAAMIASFILMMFWGERFNESWNYERVTLVLAPAVHVPARAQAYIRADPSSCEIMRTMRHLSKRSKIGDITFAELAFWYSPHTIPMLI